MKLNSEHLSELATLEINAIGRMQYFFLVQLQHWYSKYNSNAICLTTQNR